MRPAQVSRYVRRSRGLLLAAADSLEDGGDPFGADFLYDHGVNKPERLDLGDHLAIGARLFACLVEDLQNPMSRDDALRRLETIGLQAVVRESGAVDFTFPSICGAV